MRQNNYSSMAFVHLVKKGAQASIEEGGGGVTVSVSLKESGGRE